MQDCIKKDVCNRLATISGHVKGVVKMIDDGKDCSDILIQLSAIEASIKSVSKFILKNHIAHCVKDSVEKGDLSVLDTLENVIDKYK